MSEPSESVVLVEGYADRAFWAQWLESRLGWTVKRNADTNRPLVMKDPWERDVKGESWGFRKTEGGLFARVQRSGSDDDVWRDLARRLNERDRPLRALIACLDSDEPASSQDAAAARRASFAGRMTKLGATRLDDDSFTVDWGQGVAPVVRLVVWHAADPSQTPGVPEKQTLERLVCAATAAAFPERVAPVAAFLAAAPVSAEVADHKAHAGAYYAKWHAHDGLEELYRDVWREKPIADELEKRLRASGAWAAAQSL